jgi:hypothetical protein
VNSVTYSDKDGFEFSGEAFMKSFKGGAASAVASVAGSFMTGAPE